MKTPSPFKVWSIVALLTLIPAGQALAGDLALPSNNVYISDESIIYGETVKIYATSSNNSGSDLLGSVQFVDEGGQIGSDQAISALAGNSDTVFVEWTPTPGTHTVTVDLNPWDTSGDDPSNNTVTFTVTVDYDFDGDGVGNGIDPDDDNDTVKDAEDKFPYDKNESTDSDNDGTGNNADSDDDNDLVLDEVDGMPTDPNETTDADADGIGDNADPDDDNDNASDEYEVSETDPETGTPKEISDPYDSDTDDDGYSDDLDAFPTDEEEWNDNDEDLIGDNRDSNDDNDDRNDDDDELPENHGPVIVIDKYEEMDEGTGDMTLMFDASGTYDPDGNDQRLVFQWLDGNGELLSEEAIFRVNFDGDDRVPAKLLVTDDGGESRYAAFALGPMEYFKDMLWLLLLILLIALAMYMYFRYTAFAPKPETVKVEAQQRAKRSSRPSPKKSTRNR